MPGAYQIPPWLQPTDAIGAMSAGAQIGLRQASLGQNYQIAQERLEAEERMAERDAQVKEETMRMQQMRESQQMAMEDAYNQARIGLQKSDLDMQAQKAARDYAAQQQYQQQYQQNLQVLDDEGNPMDPSEAAMRAAFSVGPALSGMNFGQMAAMRKAQPIAAPQMIAPPPGVTGVQGTMWQPGHAGFDVIRDPKVTQDPIKMFQDREDVKAAEAIIKEFKKDTLGPPGKDASQRAKDKYERDIEDVNQAIETLKKIDPGNPLIPRGATAAPPGGTNAPPGTVVGFRKRDQPVDQAQSPSMLHKILQSLAVMEGADRAEAATQEP